jgi:hypothetical protein
MMPNIFPNLDQANHNKIAQVRYNVARYNVAYDPYRLVLGKNLSEDDDLPPFSDTMAAIESIPNGVPPLKPA